MTDPRPNLLYLHSHDTGRRVRPYGHAVDTPNLQNFARSGATFRQAFCANPTCSPSRACLLSGRYAHSNGMMGLAHLGGRLAEPGHAMPALLRSAGFHTALAGLQHVVPAGPDLEEQLRDVGYADQPHLTRPVTTPEDPLGLDLGTVEAAERFLKNHAADDRPFFLDAGFFATHRAAAPGGSAVEEQWHHPEARPGGDPRFVAVPAPLPDRPEIRADVADFEAAVSRLDNYHGRILDALAGAGLAENTVVVITTDHGPAFPLMKCNLTHHGTGVMLLMRGPGIPRGWAVDSLVSHVDLLPAVCELAGVEVPAWVQGRSLLRAFDAPTDPAAVREEVFAEINHHAAYEPSRSVRTHAFNYIRRLDPDRPPHPVWPNIDNSLSKSVLHRAGVLTRPQPDEALYDLNADPQECRNVAGEVEYAEDLAELRTRLDRWMLDTGDPAATGSSRTPGMRQQPTSGFNPSG